MSPGVAPFSSVLYKRWSRASASISSSFSPMITPRRRDLYPTLGAHVGAPLPPRGWHFPCRSRPARRRPLRSHGGTTGSCSRISYGSLSSHIVTNLWSRAPPLWLKSTGRNAIEAWQNDDAVRHAAAIVPQGKWNSVFIFVIQRVADTAWRWSADGIEL